MKDYSSSGYSSPIRLFAITIGGIFLAEIIAMLIVRVLEPLPYSLETLIDAGIMMALIFPLLYFLSLRPLISHINQRKRAEEKLRDAYGELELRVQERTEAWGAVNIELQEEVAERKRAEEELIETQRKLRRERDILQAVMNGAKRSHLVYLDRDFNFVRVNQTYADTCGYQPEEMIGKNHFALYPHEENEAIFARVRDTGEPIEFQDKPFEFPDQPERGITYWDWTLTPVKGEADAVEGLVFSLFETTERKRAEQEIRSLAKFPSENPNPVMRATAEGMLLYANEASQPLLGDLNTCVMQSIVQPLHDMVLAASSSQTRITADVTCAERVYSFVITPIPEMGYVNLYGRDITERKRIEEALRAARDEFELRVQERTKELADANRDLLNEIKERKEIERQLRIETTALEAAANGVIITDITGTILWANPAFLNMSGYDMEDVIGATPRILSSGKQDKTYYQHLWRTILGGNTWRGETINRRKDGSLYVEEQTITPVRHESGQLTHFIAIKQDVTEQKHAEENIRERNRKEKQLLQTIHTMQLDIARDLHDTIGQNIGYLRMKLDHMAEQDLTAREVDLKAEFSHMSDVANESFDLVRGTLAILQSKGSDDLLQLFKRYASQIVERSGGKVEFTNRGKVEYVTIHQMRQLFYIFREALSNIEKHSGASHAWVDLNWGVNLVELSIRDDGQGFDPTQSVAGHYGLKFMRERSELMHGSFQVESSPGAGTQIIIGIPLLGNETENELKPVADQEGDQ